MNICNLIGRTPLYYGAMSGRLLIVQYLIEHGASVHLPDCAVFKTTPLHVAARGNYIDVAVLLVKQGADIWLRDEVKIQLANCKP